MAPRTVAASQIDVKVLREVINHRNLRHPNIIALRKVVLTVDSLAIVMEFAAGAQPARRPPGCCAAHADAARSITSRFAAASRYVLPLSL